MSFHVGGPVPANSEAYVSRRFEGEVLEQVLAGRWVLLLGPRQHGKTTGLIRLQKTLREEGLECARVDLQGMPPCESYEQMLQWVAGSIGRSIDQVVSGPEGTDRREIRSWLENALANVEGPAVLIIDEASGIRNEEWRNAFYGQIRALANEAAEDRPGDLASRVRFVFSGTFRSETLVDPRNSPFNVCQRIETDDLTLEAAEELWKRVSRDADVSLVRQAYELVGGQPYLLQVILNRLSEVDPSERQGALDSAFIDLRAGSDDHFQALFSKVISDPALAALVTNMVEESQIPNQPANQDLRFLQVLGIARREGDQIAFRSQLYEELAKDSPQLRAEGTATEARASLVPLSDAAYGAIADVMLREIATSSYEGGIQAYNGGSFRLALAAFGCALEAVLIDRLSGLAGPAIATAVGLAKNNRQAHFGSHEDEANPMTWRLVNLIKVAQEAFDLRMGEISDALREWRNLIHPARAIQDYLENSQLEPEARAGSGIVAGLLRDL